MVLHRFDGERLVAKPHDLAILGLGGDLKAIRQRFAFHGERVVPHRGEILLKPREHPAPIMMDAARLAVHQPLRMHDPSAKRLRDGLMPEADAKERNLPGEFLDRRQRDAGGIGIAWAGREDDRGGRQSADAVHIDLVVADDLHVRAQFTERLHEVVRERIVVVNH